MNIILNLPNEINKVFEDMTDEKRDSILERNVYELITHDISFEIVDNLAFDLKEYSTKDPRRLAGAVGSIVYSFMRGGSTTWRLEKSLDKSGNLKGYKNGIREELSILLLNRDSHFPIKHELKWTYDQLGNRVPLVKDDVFNSALHHAENLFTENGRTVLELNEFKGKKRLIYKPVYWSEIHIANRVKTIMQTKSYISKSIKNKLINGLDSRLNKEQCEASVSAIENKVTFITGGAGVGKTFVIESLVKTIIENASDVIDVRVVAPTGRASLNIQERLMDNSGHIVKDYMSENEARTIHRLLKLRKSEFKGGARSKFNYKDNPLDCNFIIVDEASMIDTILMNNLLWALPNEVHIVVVGDPNQLASVGAGRVLYDLTVALKYGKQFKNAKIERPNWVTLNEVQRTSMDTNLPYLSKSLLNKDKSQRWIDFERELDKSIDIGSVHFIETKDILNTTKDMYLANTDSIILSPRHEGKDGGRININDAIMSKLGFTGFQVGVPVVQNVTNYDKGVLNGERGIVSAINNEEDVMTVIFNGGQSVDYRIKDIDDELIIAYATTVHKSQGSEADKVILPIWTKDTKSVWDISLLYTALTRAKKKVYIIGSKENLKISMNRSRNNHRFTMLAHRYKAKF